MVHRRKNAAPVSTLFVDVGGVLLTDGWDHLARKRAARHFKLEWAQLEQRHRLVFETHEEGKLSFEEYLDWVVFFEKRTFTHNQFRQFMFAQSKPYPKMLALVSRLKTQYGLKIVVISNESRALNAHRINTYGLDHFVDAFISSCFVGMRKPDLEIFRLALDVSQTIPEQAVLIDNTPMFAEIAERLGMRSIVHRGYESTYEELTSFGLRTADET